MVWFISTRTQFERQLLKIMRYWRKSLPAANLSLQESPTTLQKTSKSSLEHGEGDQERDWKGVGTTLLILMLTFSLISLAAFIFSPRAGDNLSLKNALRNWLLEDSGTKMITSTTSSHPLSEVSQSGDSVTTASDHQGGVMGLVLLTLLLRPSFTNVRFAGNDAIIYETADHSVMRLSLDNMETETLFDRSSIRSWASTTFLKNCASQYIPTGMCNLYKLLETPQKYEASYNLKYFVLSNPTPSSAEVYRKFNVTFTFSIVNREGINHLFWNNITSISEEKSKRLSSRVGITKSDDEELMMFKWNTIGNDYVFWQDGHIYYSESIMSAKPVQISSKGPNWEHGIMGFIHNNRIGSKDYDVGPAVYWSVKGQKLAFLSREKTKMKSVYMTSYSKNEKYPILVEVQYSKTHEKQLPTAVINIWDKKTRVLKQMNVQLRNNTAFHYLHGVKWIVMKGEELLVATWANRLFNHIYLTICSHRAGICKLVFEHEYPRKVWTEAVDFVSLLGTDDAIFILLPRVTSDGNSYQHIAKLTIQIKSPKTLEGLKWAKSSFLSLGNFDVTKLEAYDKTTDTVFFTALGPSPGNRHMFFTKGSPTTSDAWRCLTCQLANCSFQSNQISTDFKRILTWCKGPAPPHYYLGSNVHGKMENVVRILRDNDKENEDVVAALLPVVIRETFPLEQGFEARVKILLPTNQPTRSSSRSLPVLLSVYAGPVVPQRVSDEFKYELDEMFVLRAKFAVVIIDVRGSNGRGWKYRSAFYGALGTVEIDDQIVTIRNVLKKYPFLDARRLFVFGWSYGGFAAASIVERAPEAFFKCAISVAPVANFLYYETSYTERFMGDAGEAAYDASDITTNVSNFKTTRLLLIHGLYDENVHFQHSALFIDALQRNNIDFDLMVYPHGDHGMTGSIEHLLDTMVSFLNRCAAQR